jgi:hypothetical protein
VLGFSLNSTRRTDFPSTFRYRISGLIAACHGSSKTSGTVVVTERLPAHNRFVAVLLMVQTDMAADPQTRIVT